MSFLPWFFSFLGGLLVGASSLGVLWATGRIAGVSGLTAELVAEARGGRGREVLRGDAFAFLGGLVAAGLVLGAIVPGCFGLPPALPGSLARWSWLTWLGAGVLIGAGARLAGGCTSGHGVCGLGRFSLRSLLAISLFVATGALTVALLRAALQ